MLKRNWLLAVILCSFAFAAPTHAAQQLWQTNAKGDDIHIFDVETGATVKIITVGKNPHGVVAPADESFVVVSIENNGAEAGELVWVDPDSFDITGQLTIGPEPHAIAITPDGEWIYAPCRDGNYWVIDAKKRRVVTKIHTGGRPHNTTASPDNRFMYLSPMGKPKRVSVIDVEAAHKVTGAIVFSNSVRPPAIAYQRGLFFQHVDGLNGFEAASLKTRDVVARVKHNKGLGVRIWPPLLGFLGADGFSRCHGLTVRPGEEEIWSVCGRRLSVHELASGTYMQLANIKLDSKGYWLTFSPDGALIFVAGADAGQVYVFDAETKMLVKTLNAGKAPKRALVLSNRP